MSGRGKGHENLARALLLASAAGMSSGIPAAAQQAAAPSPEAIEEAKKLIAILEPDMIKGVNANAIFPEIGVTMMEVRARFPTLDAATAGAIQAEIRAALVKELTDEVTALMPAVYARYLTADEMREIVAFYLTPAGAKSLNVMPEIMGEMTRNLIPRMPGMTTRIKVAITGILQKHGLDLDSK
jgi:uncharacterized protein